MTIQTHKDIPMSSIYTNTRFYPRVRKTKMTLKGQHLYIGYVQVAQPHGDRTVNTTYSTHIRRPTRYDAREDAKKLMEEMNPS